VNKVAPKPEEEAAAAEPGTSDAEPVAAEKRAPKKAAKQAEE